MNVFVEQTAAKSVHHAATKNVGWANGSGVCLLAATGTGIYTHERGNNAFHDFLR